MRGREAAVPLRVLSPLQMARRMLGRSTTSTASLLPDDVPSSSAPTTLSVEQALLRHEELPEWFRQRVAPIIVLGYRPTDRPKLYYTRSLFWPISNESVNVWTHGLGGCVFLAQAAAETDPWLMVYEAAAALCFLVSATNHLLGPTSETTYDRLTRADYAAIFLLIGVSALPWFTVELHCHPELQAAAVCSTGFLALLLAWLVATQEWFSRDTPRGKFVRVAAFGSFGLTCTAFGGASQLLGFKAKPYLEAEPLLGPALLAVSVFYGGAIAIYASGWPEVRHPRTFDLVGASHQWMHVFTFTAALLSGWCIRRAREVQDSVVSCP